MSERISISTSEVRRVGTWALRGLGYPFGTADRAASILQYAVLSGEPVLGMLRLLETDIRASHARPSARVEHKEGRYTLAAQGRCLLEVGPPAIDLATSAVRRGEPASVIVSDTFGVPIIPGLVDLAARRGLDIVVAWTCDPHEQSELGIATEGWHAAAAGRRAGGTSTASLSAFLQEHGTNLPPLADTIADLPSDSEERLQGPRGFLSIHAALAGSQASMASGGVSPSAEPPTVDVDDFMQLYALERIAWAPTSERSFQQAAF